MKLRWAGEVFDKVELLPDAPWWCNYCKKEQMFTEVREWNGTHRDLGGPISCGEGRCTVCRTKYRTRAWSILKVPG